MESNNELSRIVGIFAHYGFRKTSMGDVARAIGISRQALYNRFDSKEAVFRWAASALVDSARKEALAALGSDAALADRLLAAYDSWAGQHVDMLRASPHSAEIVAMAGNEASEAANQAERAINRKVAALLIENRVDLSRTRAQDIAYTLYCASKGLMFMAESRAAYLAGMRRAIGVALSG